MPMAVLYAFFVLVILLQIAATAVHSVKPGMGTCGAIFVGTAVVGTKRSVKVEGKCDGKAVATRKRYTKATPGLESSRWDGWLEVPCSSRHADTFRVVPTTAAHGQHTPNNRDEPAAI